MGCKVLGHKGGGTRVEAIAAGQFYEVDCETIEGRMIVGWTNEADGGALVRLVNSHPAWADPVVRDLRLPE
jgi:hypothetical protein